MKSPVYYTSPRLIYRLIERILDGATSSVIGILSYVENSRARYHFLTEEPL
jgi:hypothetical protein